MIDIALKLLCGLAPVLIYLGALLLLDSYKLVTLRTVVAGVVAGGVALLVCRFLNAYLFDVTGLPAETFTRYVAPVTEESAKAVYVALLIRTRKVAFGIDAAILGFAVGAGFGLVENIFYLRLLPDAGFFVWILRGCGTAVMHGSTTAVFAILAQQPTDRDETPGWRRLLLGLGLASVLHSAYNHFFGSPVLTVVGVVGAVPLITVIVFQRSERALAHWLDLGFDADADLLAIIAAGKVAETRAGRYLMSRREHVSPTVMADMICVLRLQSELAIQAKGLLLLRKGGFDLPPPADAAERLAEMRYLERNIGRAACLALRPLMRRGHREAWQQDLLIRRRGRPRSGIPQWPDANDPGPS